MNITMVVTTYISDATFTLSFPLSVYPFARLLIALTPSVKVLALDSLRTRINIDPHIPFEQLPCRLYSRSLIHSICSFSLTFLFILVMVGSLRDPLVKRDPIHVFTPQSFVLRTLR